MELTPQDREQINQQITEYKASQPTALPSAPNGQDGVKALNDVINNNALPDKHESKRVAKRVKGIWRKWRTTTLDAKSLDIEKVACQIEIERAETQAKLNQIHREEELANAQHWLTLNKGNLEDIGANTTSKPNVFWYGLRRGFHHITKLTNNVPKIIKNLFWIGVLIVGIIVLKNFNVF